MLAKVSKNKNKNKIPNSTLTVKRDENGKQMQSTNPHAPSRQAPLPLKKMKREPKCALRKISMARIKFDASAILVWWPGQIK